MEFTLFTLVVGVIILGLEWYGNYHFKREEFTDAMMSLGLSSIERVRAFYRAERRGKSLLYTRLMMCGVLGLLSFLSWSGWTSGIMLVAILVMQLYLTKRLRFDWRVVQETKRFLNPEEQKMLTDYHRYSSLGL